MEQLLWRGFDSFNPQRGRDVGRAQQRCCIHALDEVRLLIGASWFGGGGTIRATVVEAEKPDLGSLTLVFTENPLTLRQWTVVDQQGRRTTVSLSDLQLGVALDPRLFQYQYLFSPPTQ